MGFNLSSTAGVVARASLRLLKYTNKGRDFFSAEGYYDLATATATLASCEAINAIGLGKGLTIFGSVALMKLCNPLTGEIDQDLVETILLKAPLELIAEKLELQDFTPDALQDPNNAMLLVRLAILHVMENTDSDLYEYITGCAAALVVERGLIEITDAIRDIIEQAGAQLGAPATDIEAILRGYHDSIVWDGLIPYKRITDKVRMLFSLDARICPIVLDMDGDGVETTSVNDRWVMFDLDGDGVKNRTGWVSPDDGFLVFYRNGDGIINNGREMFGNHTLRYDGLGTCRDGYEALAQEDTNGDGLVNHLDDNWQHLKVWRDLNQDGITDEGELFTITLTGI